MTLPSTDRFTTPFAGNDSTTAFPFTFKVFAKTDIEVVAVIGDIESTLVLDSDYSVTLNVDQVASPGGTVTYPISGDPLAVGDSLTIAGALPYDQTLDLPAGGNFSAATIENALDRIEMQIQQVAADAGRSLQLSVTAPSGTDTTLPNPEADKVIAWDTLGTRLVNLDASALASVVVSGTTYTDVYDGDGATTTFALTANPGSVNALDVAVDGLSLVNGLDFILSGADIVFTTAPDAGTNNVAARYVVALPVGTTNAQDVLFDPGVAGAVSRTTQSKLREFVSVVDAGGDLTGATESSTAFTNATAGGKLAFRPKGVYKRSGTNYTYAFDGFDGVLWIGDNSLNNSDDPQIVVSRLVNTTSGSGNAHSFTDSSIYSRGNTSHNSYDDRTKTTEASAAGHHASYQVGAEFASTGTFGNLYSFITSPTVSAGSLTNYIGLQVNAPTYSGAGAVVNCYGMYLPLGYGKGAYPFNNASGVVLAINNESHAMIYSLGPVQGQDGVIAGNGAGTSYTMVKTLDVVTNAGTLAGLRLQQVGTQNFDLEIPASQTYLKLSNAAGQVLKVNADKSIVYTMPTSMPTLANGEGAFAQTSDVNLRYSYRGSDGTLRSVNWTIAP